MYDHPWDPQQRKAICHKEGPVFVSAGPGAGKTSVIIARVQYLICTCNVSPENILVVTFTKAAALEMRERFFALPGSSGYISIPRFGTMHSVFLEILRKSRPQKAQAFIGESGRLDFLSGLLRKIRPGLEETEENLRRLGACMSCIINTGAISENALFPGLSQEELAFVFHTYQSYKQSHGWLDYDDILLETFHLLKENRQIARQWQKRYSYIMIDEFQDINDLQYQCLRILASPADNLYAVGDEDQCIYGFRGSSPGIIQHFLQDYPESPVILLQNNYRAPDLLLVPARKLIAHNQMRTQKQMTGRAAQEHASYLLERCDTQNAQYQKIAAMASFYHQQGIPYKSQTILLRSLRDAPLILLSLQMSGIPVCSDLPKSPDQDDLSSHFITRDITSFFRLAMGENDRRLFLKIRPVCLEHIPRYCIYENTSSPLNPEGRKELFRLRYHLAFLSKLPPYPAAEYICKAMGYETYLCRLAKQRHCSADPFFEILTRLKSYLSRWDTQKDFLESLNPDAAFTGHNDPDECPDTARDAVQIRTMHSSKGLEFDVVFIPDLNKGIVPDSRSEDAGIEEERRLLYVAMTRARRHLHLYYTDRIHDKKVFPSLFVQELL